MVTVELEKVYISPCLVAKNLEEISASMIQRAEYSEFHSIWDFLKEFEQEPSYGRIGLSGGPGTGKTLLLEYLTLVYSKNNQRNISPKAPKLLPILIELRQIRKLITSDPSTSLPELITKFVKRTYPAKLNPKETWFEQQLSLGKCLMMFDGLDEIINPQEHQIVSQWLDKHIMIYSKNLFIIASRPSGFIKFPLENISIYLELQTYTHEQREQFLGNFYWQQELLHQAYQNLSKKDEEKIKEDNLKKAKKINKVLKHNLPLNYMTSNPLLLTYVAFFTDQPSFPAKVKFRLYEQICQLLLKSRPEAKGINNIYNLNKDQIYLLMQKLALELMIRHKTQFTEEEGSEILSTPVKTILKAENPPTNSFFTDFWAYIVQITGLLRITSNIIYEFIHLSFQEYLAAVEIQQTNQEEILVNQVADSWWNNTICFYAAYSDTSKIVEEAWHKPTVSTINLAYYCWEQGELINLELKQKIEEWLEQALESRNPEIASLAARVHLSRRLQNGLATN